jgi:hypothetical protein
LLHLSECLLPCCLRASLNRLRLYYFYPSPERIVRLKICHNLFIVSGTLNSRVESSTPRILLYLKASPSLLFTLAERLLNIFPLTAGALAGYSPSRYKARHCNALIGSFYPRENELGLDSGGNTSKRIQVLSEA